MEKNLVRKQKPKYHWEILCFIIGMTMTYFGIIDELHHRVTIGHNSKGLMTVQTGAFTALLGLLTAFSSVASAYGKWKGKGK